MILLKKTKKLETGMLEGFVLIDGEKFLLLYAKNQEKLIILFQNALKEEKLKQIISLCHSSDYFT